MRYSGVFDRGIMMDLEYAATAEEGAKRYFKRTGAVVHDRSPSVRCSTGEGEMRGSGLLVIDQSRCRRSRSVSVRGSVVKGAGEPSTTPSLTFATNTHTPHPGRGRAWVWHAGDPPILTFSSQSVPVCALK